MKNSRFFLFTMFLLIAASLVVSTLTVNAFSETFPLKINQQSQDVTVVKIVHLSKGDQLSGNFTLFNIPGWGVYGGTATYPHSVTLYEPNGRVVFKYDNTNSASFDNTAFDSGDYKFEFYVSMGIWYENEALDDAQGTLNYNVVKTTSTPEKENMAILYGVIIIIVILLVGGMGIYLANRHKYKTS